MSTVARSAGARTVAVPLRLRARIAIVAVTIVGIGAFVWPLLIGFGARGAPHSTDAPWIFLVLLPLLMVVVAAELADGGMDAKAVALLGVLAGMSAILRPVSGGVTGVLLMFFVLNLWFWPFGASGTGLTASVTFSPDASVAENLSRWLRFSVTTSLSFDIPRGLATAAAILALGRPMLLALRRA
ncbi:MAG: Integral rane protein, partial [Jatrophihabitantaceae bacterium]|nr:Integral rane protein [Jatrophihabitantaceae bacterium]